MDAKKDFPLLHGNELAYLDSAATTQKPDVVIEAISRYYESENANVHRGIYELSEKASKAYETARKVVADFIEAGRDEIVFTKGATESINLLAYTVAQLFQQGKDEIVVSEMEHHSNFVPWQQLAKRLNFKFKVVRMSGFELDYEDFRKKINERTALVAFSHVSNALGTINDVQRIVELCKEREAISVVDAAQSAPHLKIDVKKIGCDFLAFSGHKMYGPMGIGVLYGRQELLDKLPVFHSGGGMIEEVRIDDTKFARGPKRFEAGTQNVAGAIVLAEAVKYIERTGFEKIQQYERELFEYTLSRLKEREDIEVYAAENNAGIISLNLKDVHPHDLSEILNSEKVAVRAGHHCCMPLMSRLGVNGTLRVSLSLYNTKEDIDRLILGIEKAKEVFK